MPVRFTESVVITRAIVRTAVRAGADRDALLRAAGLDVAVMTDPDGRVPAWSNKLLMDEAVRLTGQDALGILAGEWLEPDPSNLFWYIFLNCADLGEGSEKVQSYYRLLSDAVWPVLEVDGEEARVVVGTVIAVPEWPRYLAECCLSIWAAMMFKLVGRRIPFREVRFQHHRPADIAAHERFFRCPLRFAQPRNELVLEPALLKLPNIQADPYLGEVLRRYAELKLGRPAGEDRFLESLRRALTEALHGGDTHLAAVARRMGLGTRTLQRRLSMRNISYKALVDALRREFAGSYLRNPDVSISELAYMLGYGDIKAFYRAFRRWHDTTPAQFRRELIEAAAD
jgi:AraC-like DNA-binding protein